MPLHLQESNGAVVLPVKVVPRANKSEFVGVEGDAIKIRLKAPPVDGKANEALVRFVAELFAIPRANVEIVSGTTGRRKLVSVRGVTAAKAEQLLLTEPHYSSRR
jgi:uncharacterized protein (TIGR00251 family)